ncbi:MAG: cell wall hydrolase [Roseburia sp.]|nr:cell wall hydrolase [Roseburia sp.]MCM1097291.1 cell wall hydrolase [Ruminococcus flavefaciens]
MYKKAIGLLLAGNLVVMMGLLWAGAASDEGEAAKPVSRMSLTFEELEERAGESLTLAELKEQAGEDLNFEESEKKAKERRERSLTLEEAEKKADRRELLQAASAQNISMGVGTASAAVSGQRIVDYTLIEKADGLILSDEDMETLLRIVEAEAGSEDEDGRLLVANVVLNRVNSDRFPETVTEVVFQREHGVSQFSPVANGRYYTVEISELTISAVGRALAGEDISEGALFFASRKYANSEKMRWFDENLTFLFKHGGHEFFK